MRTNLTQRKIVKHCNGKYIIFIKMKIKKIKGRNSHALEVKLLSLFL